ELLREHGRRERLAEGLEREALLLERLVERLAIALEVRLDELRELLVDLGVLVLEAALLRLLLELFPLDAQGDVLLLDVLVLRGPDLWELLVLRLSVLAGPLDELVEVLARDLGPVDDGDGALGHVRVPAAGG